MFTIEKIDGAKAEDLLLEFDREIFPTSQRIEPRTGHWWLVWCGDECVGYAGITPSKRWQGTGYLCRAAVHRAARGHGLQRRLIRVRLAFAKRQGWSHCITDTTDNPISSNNLIECGFRLYEPRTPWAFKHSLYWIRRL